MINILYLGGVGPWVRYASVCVCVRVFLRLLSYKNHCDDSSPHTHAAVYCMVSPMCMHMNALRHTCATSSQTIHHTTVQVDTCPSWLWNKYLIS